MPGQILGDRYEIERQLGKKSGRWTLLARDLMTETPVILKLLFLDDETSEDDLKLFKREVETLQTLAHPAIPQYLGYFEINLPMGKALALIQSYIEGKSLDHHLKDGRTLAEAEAKQIAAAALRILHYLHEHTPPIVHRDIKPSNILLAEESSQLGSQVCLVDFGSVKSFSTSTDSTVLSLVGTDGYRPPEQMGRRAVRASDLYGLGATLVTGITGVDASELPRRGLRIDIDQALTLNSTFITWLKKMIEPELDKRFKTAQESLDALRMC